MIIGLTDKPIFRRDGKIRAGYKKKTATGSEVPQNCDHFLLHDAQQLIPSLGDKPIEIYFTVYADDENIVAKNDLRQYTSSELVCQSTHGFVDADGRKHGPIAAYYGLGEIAGVKASPHPGILRARERICKFRDCPDYIKGKCSEHVFLDMIVPQFSMSSIFTLENTSYNGLMNILGAFNKAKIMTGGKLTGEIFRLFKQKDDVKFMDPKSGKQSKRETDIVNMEHVQFKTYLEKFQDVLTPENLNALLALKGRPYEAKSVVMIEGPAADQVASLPEPEEQQQLPAPAAQAVAAKPEVSEADALKARADSPECAELFVELAMLLKKENSEGIRLATAKNFPSVQQMYTYLKGRIADEKKKLKAAADAALPKEPVTNAAPLQGEVLPAAAKAPKAAPAPTSLF